MKPTLREPQTINARAGLVSPSARCAVAVIAGFILFGFCSATLAADTDWYRWRGPNLDGISTEKGWLAAWPKEGPKKLWQASVGTGFSSVSVSNGRVYTMGNTGNADVVYCFDAETGKEIWKQSYPCPLAPKYYEGGTSSTPTVDGKSVYTLSRMGHMFSYDAASGKIIWSKNLQTELGVKIPEWGFAGSPLVEGNLVCINVGGAGTALDKATGKAVWTSNKEAAGYSTPVAFNQGGKPALALFSAKSVMAVEAASGRLIWQHPWDTSYDVNAADPILNGNKVFVSSGYNKGCALLQINGRQASVVWQNKNMRNHFNSCVLLQGHLYGFDESEFKCLDFQTGAVKWKESRLGKGSLMAADGKLIILGERGQLVIAEAGPAGFKSLSSAQVLGGKCWTTPVLSGGRIYCRNAQGSLVCLDVKGAPSAAGAN